METGKPGLASAPVHISSVAAQTEKRMDIQAPLTAVYIHTLPALPAQPYPQPTAAVREPAPLQLAMPPLYSKETLPFLTLHIAGGLQSQSGLSVAAAAPAPRPKSAGKHVCPHCGRDCMKPSVLEKHLRCHTGERPYPCTTCGVSFKTQSNLYKHKRTQAHARLSSESEQSSLGSQDSMSSSREVCTSSLSMDEHTDESGMEKDAMLPATTCPAHTTKEYSAKTQESVNEQNDLTPAGNKTEANRYAKVTVEEEKQLENEKPPLTISRHLPLQRQEATLFSKQWESSVSSGKPQSHESTDSGFSESSDHYPSPASVLHDHSMDSLTESTKEHVEEITSTNAPSEPGQGRQEPKDTAREQEQKRLEERISKLISENTAVVEDKQLDNVRPRKTVLSKQGSIDLPMPYTYKDSFHFEMKIGKTLSDGGQRNRAPGMYSSVPTQCSTTIEHAPLTRSNSLPFSVTLLQPERSSPISSFQSDYVTFVRRGSSGQINPTSFTNKSVKHQSSTHRPLVRQTAVDCNHATDGLFMDSSVEEASTGSLSCDGDGGDICAEPSNRKFRRKKAQKFPYNKWYMYGGGTFKKLYNTEKGGDNTAIKGRKCINPEHDVVQGTQKRLSAVHMDTVTSTGTSVNITSSSPTVGHSGCTPAKPSFVSAFNFDLKTSQHQSLHSSVKAPLRRNLSLSVLPLPLLGSLVSVKTSSLSSAEAGRSINEVKHSDTSQLTGSHVPSDRKKQKTDDKVVFPLTVETNAKAMTHSFPSVTGSVPQQETNFSYINFQNNQKHPELNGALFLPRIINANVPSVSTLPATSVSSSAKTSFLPKYQLKLPNAAENDSNSSSQVLDKPSGTDGHTVTSVLPPSHTEQKSPVVTTSGNSCKDSVTFPLAQTCDIKKTKSLNSTQIQSPPPCAATTVCPTKTLTFNEHATSSLHVVHRQFAATTITTTCLKNYQAGLCSTSIQPSATDSAPLQLPRPVAPVVANFPDRPTITTANNETSAAADVFSSQITSNPPLSHSQPLPASNQLNPLNRPYVSPNTPIVPCQVVPFDQEQAVAQNVFHVQTADLQICLQIISDEQLALIEPQIERQASSSSSHRCDTETLAPEVIQNKAQTMEISKEGNPLATRDHQRSEHQKEMNPSGSLPTLNVESIKPPLSVQFGKVQPNIHMSEHSNSSQGTISAESNPPETLGLTLRPHKHSNVSTTTEPLSSVGDVMATAASLIGVKSGEHQTPNEKHDISLNCSVEGQILLDNRVSQGRLVQQALSGQQNNVACFSPSTVNQSSTRSELLGKEAQDKLQGAMKAESEASVCKSSRLESGETYPSLQAKFSHASGAEELSGSVSIIKCKPLRQLNAQESVYCKKPSPEPTLPETVNPYKHGNRGCDRVGPSDDSAPLQEMTLGESQDTITSAHSAEHPRQFTSVSSNIQERPKNIQAVSTSMQSPPAGVVEGASLVACAGQKEPQGWGHRGTPGQPDSTDCRLKLSQDAGETNHQCSEGQGGGGVMMGEDKGRGIKTDQGEDPKVKADSLKNSRVSDHLQHLSQTHSGMSEYAPQSSQQALSTSNNLNLPSNSSQTSIFNSPQPPLEMKTFYLSQQQQWESSVIHNHQSQLSCESNSSEHIKVQAELTKPQFAFARTETVPQRSEILSHQDQKQTLSIEQGNTTKTTESCCTKITLGSLESPSLSPDVKTRSTIHHWQISHSLEVTRGTTGWMGNTQASHNNTVDNNIGMSSFPEPEQDTKDWQPNEYTMQSSNSSGRPDINNKYQSIFLTGQFHGFQPGECLASGLRPVQSCQEYSEDTSSSDDEGKLIIEL